MPVGRRKGLQIRRRETGRDGGRSIIIRPDFLWVWEGAEGEVLVREGKKSGRIGS